MQALGFPHATRHFESRSYNIDSRLQGSVGGCGHEEKSKTKLGRSTTSDELFKTRAEMRSSFVLHPQGAFRLCWDILALLLLLNDSLSLPPAIAWDLSMDSDVPSSVFLRVFFFISLGFWSSDIVINLSTAVYVKGTLAVGRRDIFCRWTRIRSQGRFCLLLEGSF